MYKQRWIQPDQRAENVAYLHLLLTILSLILFATLGTYEDTQAYICNNHQKNKNLAMLKRVSNKQENIFFLWQWPDNKKDWKIKNFKSSFIRERPAQNTSQKPHSGTKAPKAVKIHISTIRDHLIFTLILVWFASETILTSSWKIEVLPKTIKCKYSIVSISKWCKLIERYSEVSSSEKSSSWSSHAKDEPSPEEVLPLLFRPLPLRFFFFLELCPINPKLQLHWSKSHPVFQLNQNRKFNNQKRSSALITPRNPIVKTNGTSWIKSKRKEEIPRISLGFRSRREGFLCGNEGARLHRKITVVKLVGGVRDGFRVSISSFFFN